MDRFVVKRPLLPAEEAIDHIQEAGAAHHASSKKRPKKTRVVSPWAGWTVEQKQKCCSAFSQHGYRSLLRELGKQCPPASTVRTWCRTLTVKGVLRQPGRPKWLTDPEDSVKLARREPNVTQPSSSQPWNSGL